MPFFHSLRVTNIAVDPDYGLFIGYHMPTDKHEGLKTCLYLLCKDLNNLVELGTPAAQYMIHTLNTEYCGGTFRLHAFITSALPVLGSFEIVFSEQFELCLNACGRV